MTSLPPSPVRRRHTNSLFIDDGLSAFTHPFSGRLLHIVTDRLNYADSDRVFSLFPDENILLAQAVIVPGVTTVLDIGTGSGYFALCAACRGALATGVDISHRAVAFAEANAVANRLKSCIAVFCGDTYDPVGDETFNLIVSNPPFVPLPDSYGFHLAGHGGPDGTRVIRRVLAGAAGHLKGGGLLAMTCLSLQGGGVSLALRLARRLLPSSFHLRAIPIYPDSISLTSFYDAFRDVGSWAEKLCADGYDSMVYTLLLASTNPARVTNVVLPRMRDRRFSGSWQARLRRYKYWTGMPL